ncbi:hypothetical protein B0H94_10577 [Salsuginibacillus halophilus]|uniref:Uncharacterized protein n=1 Tax=Salsuginibacillus halophilus TaxID=517424 RepID=A0A2P8HL43_9BACI|nr:hypothetical protein [Salsuginibacillus halophilus]PSL46926.1 hypothetical protein B0H94_10577 [Salsuginibacillus halophilus]
MQKEKRELLEQIQIFEDLLAEVPDDPSRLNDFVKQYRILLRLQPKNYTVPLIELTSLLKEEKPLIFRAMRSYSRSVMAVQAPLETTISKERAEARLEKFKAELSPKEPGV